MTFGEWLTYQPPKVGGKPGFSLAGPGAAPAKFKKVHGFQPIVPQKLLSPAGAPLQGEGQWRLLETVRKEPAIWSTFLRPDKVHTSYVSGIVSLDQRLVKFQLRPGSEDPGPGPRPDLQRPVGCDRVCRQQAEHMPSESPAHDSRSQGAHLLQPPHRHLHLRR